MWSLAGGDDQLEVRLALLLQRRGVEQVEIQCVEAEPQRRARRIQRTADAELTGVVHTTAPSPAAGRAGWLLDRDYDVFLVDGSLDTVADGDALREHIADACRRGARLLLTTRGRQAEEATARATQMGDRIWQLMPDRYKLDRTTGQQRDHFESPDDIAEDVTATAAIDWLAALATELDARCVLRFGNLAGGFVSPAIGPNFDADVESDQRFLDQVARLDDAKIRAGILELLYVVAVLAGA